MTRTVPRMMGRLYGSVSGWRALLRGFLPRIRRRAPVWLGLPVSTVVRPGEWLPARLADVKQRDAVLLTEATSSPGREHEFIMLSQYGAIEGRLLVQSVSIPDAEGRLQWGVYFETMTPENAERYERLLKNK